MNAAALMTAIGSIESARTSLVAFAGMSPDHSLLSYVDEVCERLRELAELCRYAPDGAVVRSVPARPYGQHDAIVLDCGLGVRWRGGFAVVIHGDSGEVLVDFAGRDVPAALRIARSITINGPDVDWTSDWRILRDDQAARAAIEFTKSAVFNTSRKASV